MALLDVTEFLWPVESRPVLRGMLEGVKVHGFCRASACKAATGGQVMDIVLRPIERRDHDGWLPLWHGYNGTCGREGDTALPAAVTDATWNRFFDAGDPLNALVAGQGERLVGFAHYVFQRSTSSLAPTCHLEDLFTAEAARGRGVGRSLIEGVCGAARAASAERVTWYVRETNDAAISLYDRIAERAGLILFRKNP